MTIEEIAMFDSDDDVEDEAVGAIPTGRREPGDDFFCIRYRVWYPSFDCAIRTQFRTAEGCLRCDQGRFNLKRHSPAVRRIRWRLATGD